jgi:flavin-dependent dehydrogenase
VIGADGRHSVVSRSLGLDVPLPWPRRTGLVAHYRGVSALDRRGEMHIVPHAYAGTAPLEVGLTNIALVAGSAAVAGRAGPLEAFFADGLARIPAVAAKLAGAERVGAIRGIGPMAHRARRVAGDGFLLVGDAASFLDPFTGEGIHDAIRGALLAAPVADAALRAGDVSASRLAPYRTARRRAFWAKRQVCWLVQAFITNPPLMDYATERLARRPATALTLAGVLADLYPAQLALSPRFLAQLLRP